jgi:hypothetical protein
MRLPASRIVSLSRQVVGIQRETGLGSVTIRIASDGVRLRAAPILSKARRDTALLPEVAEQLDAILAAPPTPVRRRRRPRPSTRRSANVR